MTPDRLAGLPNLGPKSSALLRAAGIESIATLRALGAIEAYVRAKRLNSGASLNLLWALEGALTGLHWQEVARDHRTRLLLALEDHGHRDDRICKGGSDDSDRNDGREP